MGAVPEEVMQRELDMAWQHVFTWGSYGITVAMLVWAFYLGRAHRTSFYVLASLGVFIGAFAEPIYDVLFDLWFYDVHNGEGGAMYSHFTAFERVQPVWTHSGYLILYAGPVLYAGWKMYQGLATPKFLFGIWGVEIVTSCVFEVIGTGTNVYTYYGPYEMRIWNYPLVIGVLEGTQTILFTVLAVNLWRRIKSGWGMASLLYAHPFTMFGTNVGIGAPLIVALHLDDEGGVTFASELVWVATFLVYGLCALAVLGATKFLPEPLDPAEEPTGRRRDAAPHRESVGV
ncbi:hypothetical protein [Sporichthya polymorpha]|uniref:hypothetical protein n=1 Tax=Sporichthya polymorpha TaxID=35751 RepID=UPI00036E2E70|nr:hypothetical protein [Sporichthya polymorpha]